MLDDPAMHILQILKNVQFCILMFPGATGNYRHKHRELGPFVLTYEQYERSTQAVTLGQYPELRSDVQNKGEPPFQVNVYKTLSHWDCLLFTDKADEIKFYNARVKQRVNVERASDERDYLPLAIDGQALYPEDRGQHAPAPPAASGDNSAIIFFWHTVPQIKRA